MTPSEQKLKHWCVTALVLVVVGIALAISGLRLESSAGLAFRVVFGLAAAVVVIGFYLVMFSEAMRTEHGVRNAASIVLFIVFPVGSAFLYYWWTRRVRARSAS